eukprot:TRINITY_DN3322_c0_g1_i2.p1 TRINITY_DN3322_c0_g1~~TRINITY_DN3322_c0_g1_i2.p1  ORF type:complete len:272 (+),score=30.35 TRINITY_DN3322_c0_g1_i2:284-1099(+)
MSLQPDPEQFMLAESVPPSRLVGHRIWVEGFGPGEVLKFEKAWVGFGTSTHTVKFDSGNVEKIKLRRHANGKPPFILLTPASLTANPAKNAFRYIDDAADSGSEPATPSSIEGSLDIPGVQSMEQDGSVMAPGSLVEHLESQAWNICAAIANPPGGYASSALSESFSESPSYAFSCTPPESVRFQMTQDPPPPIPETRTTYNGISAPMAIPQAGEEPVGHDPHEICRVDHLLSESGTIFTPGEHKWICEASPPQNQCVAMMRQGPPTTQGY